MSIDLTSLTDDGDTLDLEDGRTLRLRIELDFIDPFEEFDAYGKVAANTYNSLTGRSQRPEGFDGNAEKITVYNDVLWWQPPPGAPDRGTPEFAKFRQLVSDLASWGMKIVFLEVLSGLDAYRQPIVVDVASLGGIDSLEDGYVHEVVSELAAEVGLD